MDKLNICMQGRLALMLPPKETKLKIENRLAEVSCNLNVLQWQFVLALMAAMMPIPNKLNFFCVEVKEMANSVINLFSDVVPVGGGKVANLTDWYKRIQREDDIYHGILELTFEIY